LKSGAEVLHETATQQRFAGAHLAGDFDETFTGARRNEQQVQPALRRTGREEKTGVRG